jgi:hypothetical protein
MRKWIMATTLFLSLPMMAEDSGKVECTPVKKAKELLGKEGCVVGRVMKVNESRAGNVYLNFCSDYRNCGFSAVALKNTGAQLGDLHDLEGKVVEFHGPVEDYEGQPEIKLKAREQLRISDAKAVKPVEEQRISSLDRVGSGSGLKVRRPPLGHIRIHTIKIKAPK